MEKKKNIENLIKGFEIFHATHPDYKLILAGKIDRRLKIYDLGFMIEDADGKSIIKKN